MTGIDVLVFVYGTLQRGRALHEHLAAHRFVGEAKTQPEYRLYRIGWYPGLVEAPSSGEGLAIHGEVWDVDEPGLRLLDEVEDVSSGLYERRSIRLQKPFDQSKVLAYFYLGDVEGCSDNGDRW
ncbi:MAG: gamma-glutamylaminecyclotransferase [Planctomycetaceae bacterium]